MLFGSKKQTEPVEKIISFEVVAEALAKSITVGDIVSFRLLFLPFSPARQESSEYFDSPKYAYLHPDEELKKTARFQHALAKVRQDAIRAHIGQELDAKRPAQLHSELLLLLADNAVLNGKYSSAAQAYELLRIRARIQEEFYAQADAALERHDIPKAVRGYIIATGLAYNYSAFPEPLPLILDYQTSSLMLHAVYPNEPTDCIGYKEPQDFLQTALGYLLVDPIAAGRLANRDLPMLWAFLKELILQRDPQWNEFAARYRETVSMAQELQGKVEQMEQQQLLPAEIMDSLGDTPKQLQTHLLGRSIDPGEWWQYLKEIAYEHPAAALFLCRQAIHESEVLVPRCNPEYPILAELGLTTA